VYLDRGPRICPHQSTHSTDSAHHTDSHTGSQGLATARCFLFPCILWSCWCCDKPRHKTNLKIHGILFWIKHFSHKKKCCVNDVYNEMLNLLYCVKKCLQFAFLWSFYQKLFTGNNSINIELVVCLDAILNQSVWLNVANVSTGSLDTMIIPFEWNMIQRVFPSFWCPST